MVYDWLSINNSKYGGFAVYGYKTKASGIAAGSVVRYFIAVFDTLEDAAQVYPGALIFSIPLPSSPLLLA